MLATGVGAWMSSVKDSQRHGHANGMSDSEPQIKGKHNRMGLIVVLGLECKKIYIKLLKNMGYPHELAGFSPANPQGSRTSPFRPDFKWVDKMSTNSNFLNGLNGSNSLNYTCFDMSNFNSQFLNSYPDTYSRK